MAHITIGLLPEPPALQPCSDYDYNDLILSFTTTDEPDVPEPATLTLLGAGLLAAAWARRRVR